MKRFLFVLAMCWAATTSAATSASSPSAAEQVDQYLQARMAAARIPCMQVAVVKDGRIALLRHYGTASVEFSVPVADDTVFAINSITKLLITHNFSC